MIHVPLYEQISCNVASTVPFIGSLMLYKPKKHKLLTIIGYFVLFYIMNYTASSYAIAFPESKNQWISVVFNIIYALYLLLFLDGKVSEKIIYTLISVGNLTLSAILTTGIYNLLDLKISEVVNVIPTCVSMTIIYFIFNKLFIQVKFRKKVITNRNKFTLPFTVLVLCQNYILTLSIQENMHDPIQIFNLLRDRNDGIVYVIFGFILIVFDVIILALISRLNKYYKLIDQEKLAIYQRDVVKKYNHKIDDNIELISNIIHDCSDSLKNAERFLSTNQSENVISEIRSIEEKINSVYTKRYCLNPLVNTILISKIDEHKTDINAEISVDLPEDTGIENIDICRIITNLVDNAINALDNCEPDKRYLEIAIKSENDRVFFKVINTFCPNQKNGKKRTGDHGLGKYILNDLSEKYNGKFHTTQTDNIYTAMVTLCTAKKL